MKKSLTFFSTLLISLSTISNINKIQGIFTNTTFKTALNSTTIITGIQKIIKTINDDINNQFKTLEDPALGLQDRLDEFQRLDEHITNFSKQLKQLRALLLVSKVISTFNKKTHLMKLKITL